MSVSLSDSLALKPIPEDQKSEGMKTSRFFREEAILGKPELERAPEK
jgi:hypothetical protein